MHVQSRRCSAVRRRSAHRLTIAMLSASLVALLAALPTTPATASPPIPSTTLTNPVSAVPAGEVEKLLAEIPLSELDTTQLAETLSKLPGLSTLPAGKLNEALNKVVEDLTNKNATVGELLDSTETVPTLETELGSLLSLQELLELPILLKGKSLTTQLTETLGSLRPSELLDKVLSSAATPEQLLTRLFASLDLEPLLNTTLSGEPFDKTTVGELASKLGTTPATLDKELDTNTTELPETATALTTPLTDGKTLGVLDGLDAVTLGLLNSPEGKSGKEGGGSEDKETTKETNNTEGGGAQKEGGNSNGPTGSSPTGSNTTTVIVSVPAQSPIATNTDSSKKTGELRILSHHVSGRAVTLVVQVPGAGKLALDGKGIIFVSRQTAKAERVTLRTTLTKASVASMRRHRHKLAVKLEASFKLTGGPRSSALLTVNFI